MVSVMRQFWRMQQSYTLSLRQQREDMQRLSHRRREYRPVKNKQFQD